MPLDEASQRHQSKRGASAADSPAKSNANSNAKSNAKSNAESKVTQETVAKTAAKTAATQAANPAAKKSSKAATPMPTTPPRTTALKPTVPKTTTPKTMTPKTTAPKATTPKTTALKATTPKATTPKAAKKRSFVRTSSGKQLMWHTLALPELIAGAKARSAPHIDELQRRFGGQLLREVQFADPNVTHQAVVDSVFLSLPEALARYQETGQFKAWLRTIAERKVLDEQRKRKRRPEQFPESGFEAGGGAIPGRTFEREELLAALLERLTDNEREVMVRVIRGFDPRSIAEELKITRNVVDQTVFRARRRMRARLKQLGLTFADFEASGVAPRAFD